MRRALVCALLCWPCVLVHGRSDLEVIRSMKRCRRDPLHRGVRKPNDLKDVFSRILGGDFAEFSPEVISTDPWIVYFRNFLSDAEVDTITKHMFNTDFHMSQAGGNDVSKNRHSETAFCTGRCNDADIMQTLVGRAGNITHVPSENFDFVQALRYRPGMYYRPHHDNHPTFSLSPSGCRIYTMFVYLSDVEQGGETAFPKLNVSTPAKKGAAVLFVNTMDSDPDTTDPRTTHEAITVTEGEKRGLNLWLYQHSFKDFWQKGCSSIEFADEIGSLKQKQGKSFVAIDGNFDSMDFTSLPGDVAPQGVSLTIVNPSPNPIGIFWVSPTGEQLMSQLPPKERYALNTYPAHRFRLRRGSTVKDEIIREYTVSNALQQTLHARKEVEEL